VNDHVRGQDEIPNTKHQYPNKFQLPGSKPFGNGDLDIGYCLEFVIWGLGIVDLLCTEEEELRIFIL
jgi:hypothetical protein